MSYYIGPWIWRESVDLGNYWDAPVGTTARIDLRPLPCNIPGVGLFVLPEAPRESGYIELTDGLEKPLSKDAQIVIANALSLPSIRAWNLRDALVEVLTTSADPTGAVRCLPLIPKLNGMLEIVLSGHGVVWERKFTGESDPAWPNIQKVLQGNYRKVREQALLDGTQHHRKYLDTLNAKYAISTEKFIPDDLPVETALPRATTVSDDFNRANESLDAGNWTEYGTLNFSVLNNEVVLGGSSGWSWARYDSPLSSDDFYARLTETGRGSVSWFVGVIARAASDATYTHYMFDVYDAGDRLRKRVDGAMTTLDESNNSNPGFPFTVEVEPNGSTIRGILNAGEVYSVVDTSITGNVHGGIFGYYASTSNRGDNFVAEDLEAAIVGNPYWYYRMIEGN